MACERCDWKRIDGPGLEVFLAGRQRDYDLHAAVRVASGIWPVDQFLLEGLAASVRGGPLPSGQIERLMAHAEQPAVTSPGIVFALRRLVSGKTDAVAFVEIGPDAVSWQTLVANELGIPVQIEGESHPWTAILQVLPIHIGLRYLLMAGGVGVAAPADPAVLIAEVGQSITSLLTRCPATVAGAAASYRAGVSGDPDHTGTEGNQGRGTSRRVDTVLVRRTRGWPLLEAAEARARAVIRPVTEIMAGPDAGSLADVVDAVAVHAPLRYAYDLILVEILAEAKTRTRVVHPRSHELFPAGTAVLPGTLPATIVDVSPVTGYAAEQLVLPIVARRGPVADLRDVEALDKQLPLVAMAGLDASTGGSFQVRVELAKPGRTQLLPPAGFLPAGTVPGGWPGLMAEVPQRLQPVGWLLSEDLDLVLLIELGAAWKQEKAVAARVRLAKRLVHELRDVPQARIAVLGYRDHFGSYSATVIGMPGQEAEALVVGSTGGFSTRDDLQWMFQQSDWWAAVPLEDDHAAPVEHALWLLAGDTWAWRPDARHVVLIVGRRPPHSARAQPSGTSQPCPDGLSWRTAFKQLQRDQALQCFAVLDDAPAPGYAANAWQALTAPGRFRIARRPTVRTVAQDCGLTPQSRTQLRLATLARAALFPAGLEGAP